MSNLNKPMNTAMAGLAIAAAVGTAAYAANSMSTSRQRRKMRRTADRAMKNVSQMIDSVAYMVK